MNIKKKLAKLESRVLSLEKNQENLPITAVNTTSRNNPLVIGRWYKIDHPSYSNFLGYFKGLDQEGNFTYYGFNTGGGWKDYDCYPMDGDFVICTKKDDIKGVLVNEAIKRGFKDDCRIDRSEINKRIEDALPIVRIDRLAYPNDPEYHYCENDNYLEYKGFVIFSEGKWATIIEEIDWSVPGQLVIANDGEGDAIIMTTGDYTKEKGFKGIVLKTDNICEIFGEHRFWDEHDFELLQGEIILKNEQ